MNASQVAIRQEHTPQQPMLYHELANLFPLLEGDAFWALVEDVRVNGVREPIVLLDGQILDGRNRYHAAREAGVAYQVADYVGDDPLGYVLSLNLKRRHLSESQRAMVAAKLAKLPPGRPKETAQISAVSQPRAAELLNVSRGSIQNAAAVQEHATPTLIAAVEAGEVAVSAAATVARLPEPMQAEIVQIGPQAVREAAAEVRAGADVEQVRAAAGLLQKRLFDLGVRPRRAVCQKMLDRHGALLLERGGTPETVPTVARQVYDVTGAGDTVIATLATLVAAGLSLRDAMPLANKAGGVVVGKFGTATVSYQELFA